MSQELLEKLSERDYPDLTKEVLYAVIEHLRFIHLDTIEEHALREEMDDAKDAFAAYQMLMKMLLNGLDDELSRFKRLTDTSGMSTRAQLAHFVEKGVPLVNRILNDWPRIMRILTEMIWLDYHVKYPTNPLFSSDPLVLKLSKFNELYDKQIDQGLFPTLFAAALKSKFDSSVHSFYDAEKIVAEPRCTIM